MGAEVSAIGLPAEACYEPHFDEAGLCQCGCGDCTTRTAHFCVCMDCQCDPDDPEAPAHVA